MLRTVYTATITLAVRADSLGEACDAIAEPLREMINAEDSSLLDWAYVYRNGVLTQPEPQELAFPYEEGDAFYGKRA